MKIKYYTQNFLEKEKIYGKNFRYFNSLCLFVVEEIHLYNSEKRTEKILHKNQIIELESMQREDDFKNGLYQIDDYYGYVVSIEELNAKTIPMYMKKNSYSKEYSYEMEGLEIRKNGNPFPIYRTPKFSNDAKKVHYLCVDRILKKMFLDCGDIAIGTHMNMILKTVKEFDRVFAKTNSAELSIEIKEYLEKAYENMLELEPENKRIKTAREYFELSYSTLTESEFLEELKIKKQFLDAI